MHTAESKSIVVQINERQTTKLNEKKFSTFVSHFTPIWRLKSSRVGDLLKGVNLLWKNVCILNTDTDRPEIKEKFCVFFTVVFME